MRVDEDTIRHVASVARLNIKDEDIKRFFIELKEVIDSFSKIDEVDTAGVKPSFQPIKLNDRLREDIEEKCLTQQEALSNSTKNIDGYFKGPKAV